MTAQYRFVPEPIMSDVEYFFRLEELFTGYLGQTADEAWSLTDPEATLLNIATENYSYWLILPTGNTHQSDVRFFVQRWNDGVGIAKRLYLQTYHKEREIEMSESSVKEAHDVFSDMVQRKARQAVPALAMVNRQG